MSIPALDIYQSTSEEEVRERMVAEAAKYPPNWLWRLGDWLNRQWRMLLMFFFVAAATYFVLSGEPLNVGSVLGAILVCMVIVFIATAIIYQFGRSPARWTKLNRNFDLEHILHILLTEPAPLGVEYLRRNTDSPVLATVMWFESPNPQGGPPSRRGILIYHP